MTPRGPAAPRQVSGGGSPQGSLTLALSVLRCSDKFTRFCQWKNVELNIHVSRDPCAAGEGTWVPGRRLLPWRSEGHHTGQGHPRVPWAAPAGAGSAPALTLRVFTFLPWGN